MRAPGVLPYISRMAIDREDLQVVESMRNEEDDRDHAAGRRGVLIVGLAELPAQALLDESALARELSVTKRTVRRMVGRFELPPPVSFAGRSMWQAGRVIAWFEERAERVARNAQREARKLDS